MRRLLQLRPVPARDRDRVEALSAAAARVTADRRVRVVVEGVVQGVGFRPFVHALAQELGLSGMVANDHSGVVIELQGPTPSLDTFLARVRTDAPPLAVVEAVRLHELPPEVTTGFRITGSVTAGHRRDVPIPPDTAPCAACRAEVDDHQDRRHAYPFTNCTRCGPRFSIVTDVPYDRARTTMAAFPLCEACAAEYRQPADRRFHAEPICCPACGPTLELVVDGERHSVGPGAIAAAATLLAADAVVAVKGVGGYHLAVVAGSETAVATLRRRKARDEKPFAVLVRDVDAAGQLCHLSPEGRDALTAPAAPIVLLPRRLDAPVAPSVAPGNRWLGLMLAASPLHQLLADAVDAPLVLTSGNVSGEPIAHVDADALARLAPIADAFLTHDRPIHIRADDSVVRVVAGRTVPVRRSRGYSPSPLRLPWRLERPVLAVGAQLKNTFCLAKGDRAFVSHHIGDLENPEVLKAFETGIEHYRRLFDVAPQVVAHDLHPEYLSTKYALDLADMDAIAVQHHHAHIAACLADNGHEGPVIGVAFDGLGYGTDAALWGGEVLLADLADFERVGALDPVPQPGGAAAVRQPWRMAAAHLVSAFGGTVPEHLAVVERHHDQWDPVLQLCRSGVQAPPTTSIGRLFDAVAAIIGVRDEIRYEGQAAIELEQRADPLEEAAYEVGLGVGDLFTIRGADLIRAVVDDLTAGAPIRVVAARVHNGVASCIATVCDAVRQRCGLRTVALSGGVFQNALLLERTVPLLERTGFEVLTHHHVPPNDGGISLGQTVVAGARDRRRR